MPGLLVVRLERGDASGLGTVSNFPGPSWSRSSSRWWRALDPLYLTMKTDESDLHQGVSATWEQCGGSTVQKAMGMSALSTSAMFHRGSVPTSTGKDPGLPIQVYKLEGELALELYKTSVGCRYLREDAAMLLPRTQPRLGRALRRFAAAGSRRPGLRRQVLKHEGSALGAQDLLAPPSERGLARRGLTITVNLTW